MKRLLQKKLAWGIVVMVVTQILGMLPAADFLPPIALKIVCFVLGIFLATAKGVEMFFEKSEQLESTIETASERTAPDGTQISQVSKTVTTKPMPEAAPTKKE